MCVSERCLVGHNRECVKKQSMIVCDFVQYGVLKCIVCMCACACDSSV